MLTGAPAQADTAERVAPEIRLGYVWGIAAVAAIGGFLFGDDWVVIGGAKPFYESYFGLHTAAQIGWANSCALVPSPPCLPDGRISSPALCSGASQAVWLSGWLPIFRPCTSQR
jgi:hypothetical protein